MFRGPQTAFCREGMGKGWAAPVGKDAAYSLTYRFFFLGLVEFLFCRRHFCSEQ